MKTHLALLIAILFGVSCTGTEVLTNRDPIPEQLPSAVPTAITNESQRWAIYSSDPQFLWNRLFHLFYGRSTNEGREYGWDSLDPLLWPETTYLLEGQSYQQAIQLLDEFLSSNGDTLISNPLKRAMFQRDMWAVFDWLTLQSETYSSQRAEIQSRIVQIIRRLALSKQEIHVLPDNYSQVVSSQAFATSYQKEDPFVPFLPAGLFSNNMDWICVGRQGGPIAMTHTQEFPFFGRSVFLIFVRVPGGREATLNFLHQLNTNQSLDLLPGTEVALVRRALLIDQDGELVPSPLVESVQIRHFFDSKAQFFYEFKVVRPLLFSGTSGGMQPVEKEIMLFRSHGEVFEEAKVPSLCVGCHIDEGQGINGINSILSYSRQRFPLPDNQRPVLVETMPELEAQTVIAWKLTGQAWETLKTLWQQSNP